MPASVHSCGNPWNKTKSHGHTATQTVESVFGGIQPWVIGSWHARHIFSPSLLDFVRSFNADWTLCTNKLLFKTALLVVICQVCKRVQGKSNKHFDLILCRRLELFSLQLLLIIIIYNDVNTHGFILYWHYLSELYCTFTALPVLSALRQTRTRMPKLQRFNRKPMNQQRRELISAQNK